MSINETANTRVELDGKNAEAELKKLSDAADKLNKKLNEQRKANDLVGWEKTKKELSQIQKQQKQITRQTEDYNSVLKNLNGSSFKQIQKAQSQLTREIKGMKQNTKEEIALFKKKEQQLREVNQQYNTMKKRIYANAQAGNKLKMVFQNIAGFMGIGVAIAGLKRLWDNIRSVRGEFEKYAAVLTNALGSKSAAQQSMKMIQDFASKTPFQVDQITDAYVRLTNYGLRPTRDELRKYGDVAASVGKSLNDYVEALADASQFEFERLKEFGIRAKKQGDQITFTFRGQQTVVEASTAAVKDYMASLGDFEGIAGSMAAIARTEQGLVSNLGDSWDRLLNLIGTSSSGVYKNLIAGITGVVDTLGDWFEIPTEEKLIRERTELNALVGALMDTNDGEKARDLLLAELQTKYPNFLENLDTENITTEQLASRLEDVNKQYERRIALAIAETLYAQASEDLAKTYTDEVGVLKEINELETKISEGRTSSDQITGVNRTNLELIRQKSQLEKIKAERNEINETIQKAIELVNKETANLGNQDFFDDGNGGDDDNKKGKKVMTVDEYIAANKQRFEAWKEAEAIHQQFVTEQMMQNQRDQRIALEEQKKALDEEFTLPEEENVNDIPPEVTRAGKMIRMQKEYELRIARQSAEGQKQILADQLNAQEISYQEYKDTITQIDKELQNAKLQAAATAAGDLASLFGESTVAYKLFATTEALISTYLAANKALASAPPPFNYILMGTTIVKGLANVAKINGIGVDQAASGLYPVVGNQDGRRYNASLGNTATGMVNSPTLLVGERPEMVIDNNTMKNLQINYPGVIDAIYSARIPQFASGMYPKEKVRETNTVREYQKDAETLGILREATLAIRELRQKGVHASISRSYENARDLKEFQQDYEATLNDANM